MAGVPGEGSGVSVLVADDDQVICALLSDYLSQFGFRVSCANTAEACLKSLAQNHPQILLLDNQLPDCVGVELLAEIRTKEQNAAARLPVVLISADCGPASDQVNSPLADVCLPKPFNLGELRDLIQTLTAS